MKKKRDVTSASAGKMVKTPKTIEKEMLSPIFVEAERMFEKLDELTRETSQRAYELFLNRGGEFGKEFDDWSRAETDILRPVPVEVTEQNGNLNVTAAVPGFNPEEIEISVKDNVLIMNGRTEKTEERTKENVVYSDFESSRFFNRVMLPTEVDADNVKAQLKDGFLHITLPKITPRASKHIEVSTG